VGKLTIETQIKTLGQTDDVRNTECIPGDYVMLSVTDNGCGMNKETLDNLFEPFFTTKEIGKGTGLGLATIYGIVKQNKGIINVYSEPGQGTTFKIYLPRFHTSEETQEKTLTEKPAPIGDETILLVEDEPAILEMTRRMLERKGYSVVPAATPADAISIADTYVGKIDLLMTDVVMPEMNGRDLAKKITAIFPEIKLLFMSGYSANVITQQGVLNDGVAFMQKPFSMNELAEKIRGILDDPPKDLK
jgi:CheY-like chemotaxis protein